MIQIVVSVVILLGIYKFLERQNEDIEFDWFMVLTFIIVPILINALLGIAIFFLKLPEELMLLSVVIYFLVPFLILSKGLDFSNSDASKFAVFVPAVMIGTELIISLSRGGT